MPVVLARQLAVRPARIVRALEVVREDDLADRSATGQADRNAHDGRHLLRESRRVVVEPGLFARFFWREQPPVLKPDHRIRVELTYRETGAPELRFDPRVAEKEAAVEIGLPASGRYDVVFRIQTLSLGRWATAAEAIETIELFERSEPQDCQIDLPEALQAYVSEDE